MIIEFPFKIGQAIWTHTKIDEEWVTVQATVKEYTVSEFGVDITITYAGGRSETLDISDGEVAVDEEQVKNQYLFADRHELMRFLGE